MKTLTNRIEGKKTNVFVRPNLFPALKLGTNSGLKRILFFLIVILFSTTGFAGEIAKLVLKAKAQGSTFIPVNGLLVANSTYFSQSIQQQVVNPKYFNFNSGVALDLIQNRKQYITITLPGISATGNLVIDLIAAPEPNYDFKIKTGSGQEYSGKDIKLVHYRGIVRNYESQSLVFLSVSDDDVSMDISINGQGEYEIYKDKIENIHVFHNNSDIAHLAEPFNCGGYDELQVPTTRGNPVNKAAESGKCLYLFLEAEYENFLEAESDLDKLQKRILKVFNKTQGLYEDIDVTLRLRELKLWNIPDPYTYNTVTSNSQADWAAKKQDYILNASIPTDVNLVHLLTTFASGGIMGTGGGFKCIGNGVPHPSIQRYSGACNNSNCRKNEIKSMAHEIAHSLGCGHTKDCHWNGNCTPLDNAGIYPPPNTVCNGVNVGPCGAAPDPEEGFWTVMSAQGEFSLWKGFGEQPGNKIESFVNSQQCLSSCNVSCDDLPNVINIFASQNVNSGDDDYEHSEIATYAYNKIYSGGAASYYSATRVFLKPGFRAHYGSDFHAAIKPCFYYADEERRFVTKSDETAISLNEREFIVQAYPNPSTGELVIDLTGNSIYKISVVNLMGITVYEGLNVSSKRIELDLSDKAKGIYFIKVINQSDYVKTIKLVLQ